VRVLVRDVREPEARLDVVAAPLTRGAAEVLLACGGEAQEPEDAPRDLLQDVDP
jgi:hypothetical protein